MAKLLSGQTQCAVSLIKLRLAIRHLLYDNGLGSSQKRNLQKKGWHVETKKKLKKSYALRTHRLYLVNSKRLDYRE